jgi:hypothetical protein
LRDDILDRNKLLVKLFTATLTKPLKAIELARIPAALYHETYRIGPSLRRMGYSGREKEDVSFANVNIYRLTLIHYFHKNVALKLIEEFLSFIIVVVFAGVGAADDHDHEVGVLVYHLVTNRRLKRRSIFVNPLLEIERIPILHPSPLLLPT